jgi:hypothetical protein
MAGEARDLIITLVHGTWGQGIFPSRKARWFEPGSRFHGELTRLLVTAGLRHRIDAVRWPGSNSVFEREKAAIALANELAAQREAEPEAQQIVVAHSHGGNVALKALHRLSLLDPSGAGRPIGVATLATPFLQIYRVPDNSPRPETYLDIGIVLGGLIWLFAVPWLQLRGDVTVALALVLSFVLTFALMQVTLMPWPMGGGGRIDRPTVLATAANYSVDERHPPDILVLRGVDDEASLGLALGALVARFNHFVVALFGKLSWAIRGIGILAGCAALFVGVNPAAPTDDAAPGEPFFWIIGLILFCILVAMLAGLIFMQLGKFGMSRELVWATARCDIAVNSSPDAKAGVRVVTLPQTAASERGLRHYLYDHDQCAAAVAEWAGELARRPAPPP